MCLQRDINTKLILRHRKIIRKIPSSIPTMIMLAIVLCLLIGKYHVLKVPECMSVLVSPERPGML